MRIVSSPLKLVVLLLSIIIIDRDSISVYFVFVTFKLYSLFIYSSAELSFFATLYLKN